VALVWARLPIWVTGLAFLARVPGLLEEGGMIGDRPEWAAVWGAAGVVIVASAFASRGSLLRLASGVVAVVVLIGWASVAPAGVTLATQAVFLAWAVLVAWSWVNIR
jgi:hypothetical protein